MSRPGPSGPVLVRRARDRVHKFEAVFSDGAPRVVRFGRQGYSDYTKHHDAKRKSRYIVRHQRRENWGRSGSRTAGFWSRWLLWSKPSFKAALAQTQKVLGRKILFKRSGR
jgi:hypothetical protein